MRLYNTLTRSTEPFAARDGHVGVYVCGVTPYDTTHAGHAFTFLVFDVLVRFLRASGVDVTYVQNVTDIDDDILRKAKAAGVGWRELGESETAALRRDMRGLNATDPDHFVLATDHIDDMVTLISALVDAGYAYESGGSVYFSVVSDSDYGKLSQIPRDQMLAVANERGNVPDDPKKRDPLDFVLWQAAAPDEPMWDTPWGPGRPGWHIECSAMSTRYLGNTIDIHGGGEDLVFPHHESEMAQSELATGDRPFARAWMHVAMVGYQGEKMSKSLGNLILVRDVLAAYHPDALRLYLLSHHYREAWEYVDDEVERWDGIRRDLVEASEFSAFGRDIVVDVSSQREKFYNAFNDDLNVPEAIEALREVAQAILEAPEDEDTRDAQDTLRELADVIGLSLDGPD